MKYRLSKKERGKRTLALLRQAIVLEQEAQQIALGLPANVVPTKGKKTRLDKSAIVREHLSFVDLSTPSIRQAVGKVQDLLRQVESIRWEVVRLNDALAQSQVTQFAKALDSDDVLQDAREGLYDAAKRFSPERGIAFSTYANWWIRASILRNDMGDVAAGTEELLRRVRQLTGQGKSDSEIVDILGLTHTRLDRLRVLQQRKALVRLDASVLMGEEGVTLHDLISCENAEETREHLLSAIDSERVISILGTLSQRSQLIFRLYYGLGGCEQHNLNAIAKMLDISRERVRQIVVAELENIRAQLNLADPADEPTD